MTVRAWPVRSIEATVGELHDLRPDPAALDPGGELWWCRPTDAALAVGQRFREPPDGAVSPLPVCRRRSGGSAVAVVPGEMVWIDVVVPTTVPWATDLRGSMLVVGAAWATALSRYGVSSRVHDGAMQGTQWSDHVCFAGVGPGEVLDPDGRKIVGLSQRRTASWIRVQTMCHLRWHPDWYAGLLGGDVAPIAGVTATVDVDPAAMVAAVASALGP